MASEWYVQHGGKEHGPLTSATLKKLASEGKITPATSVRLGAQGAWGPASRVQGLFGAAQAPAAKSAAPAPNPAALATPAAKPAAPVAKPKAPAAKPEPAVQDDPFFDLPPPAPPVAKPIARVPVAAAVLPQGVQSPNGSMKLLIFGGITLTLCIAGVIAVVLYFTLASAPTPVVQPIVATPAPVEPPATPPKMPEPVPEPVWTDASEGIQQGEIKAGISEVKIEQVRLEDITTMKRGKPQPMLKIKVVIENTSANKIIEFPGWIGGTELAGQGLGQLVGNGTGGALAQLAGSGAILTDNVGNKYKQTPISLVFGGALTFNQDNSVRPGKSAEKELLFAPPLDTIEYLRLELPSAGFSGSDSLRFQIPKAMVKGLGG